MKKSLLLIAFLLLFSCGFDFRGACEQDCLTAANVDLHNCLLEGGDLTTCSNRAAEFYCDCVGSICGHDCQ